MARDGGDADIFARRRGLRARVLDRLLGVCDDQPIDNNELYVNHHDRVTRDNLMNDIKEFRRKMQ